MPRTALFVIDIQRDLALDSLTEIPAAARIRDAGASILAATRAKIDAAREQSKDSDFTVVFVQHEEKPEDGVMIKGSVPWELVFKPIEGATEERLVAKSVRDTFEANPELADRLKAEGVEKVVAFGIQSECCVKSTCEGALAAGFEVILLSGAHSTYNGKSKTAEEIERDVEKYLVEKGVKVVSWKDWNP
ncbi:Isochorismatase hydrolase [Lophium mytilinum]|uniref:Isochorismatase hydrolase n=1 Tax=Lophium mytilinum TaxID=390894 RepID=A0A6A6RDS8_9PEZI|nr:Isochorismatase hydrolase [Lophium mytilinum]